MIRTPFLLGNTSIDKMKKKRKKNDIVLNIRNYDKVWIIVSHKNFLAML